MVFVDEFNELHRRGFRLHGSHIPNCLSMRRSWSCRLQIRVLLMPYVRGGTGQFSHGRTHFTFHNAGICMGEAQPEAQALLRVLGRLLTELAVRSSTAAASTRWARCSSSARREQQRGQRSGANREAEGP